MINSCINCRVRRKKGQIYFFCIKRKAEIEQKECFRCNCREFKKTPKMTVKTRIKPISKNNKVTKATSIPKKVKMEVWERDNHRCIFCKKTVEWNFANSHYIKRSHQGMGIPKNIMTNCAACHKLFEETEHREQMKKYAKEYFMSKYDDWNEKDLVYSKWNK